MVAFFAEGKCGPQHVAGQEHRISSLSSEVSAWRVHLASNNWAQNCAYSKRIRENSGRWKWIHVVESKKFRPSSTSSASKATQRKSFGLLSFSVLGEKNTLSRSMARPAQCVTAAYPSACASLCVIPVSFWFLTVFLQNLCVCLGKFRSSVNRLRTHIFKLSRVLHLAKCQEHHTTKGWWSGPKQRKRTRGNLNTRLCDQIKIRSPKVWAERFARGEVCLKQRNDLRFREHPPITTRSPVKPTHSHRTAVQLVQTLASYRTVTHIFVR